MNFEELFRFFERRIAIVLFIVLLLGRFSLVLLFNLSRDIPATLFTIGSLGLNLNIVAALVYTLLHPQQNVHPSIRFVILISNAFVGRCHSYFTCVTRQLSFRLIQKFQKVTIAIASKFAT